MSSFFDKAKDAYRKEYESNPVFTLFLTILIAFFVIFVIAAIVTGGDSAYYVFSKDPNLFFSDHFDSVLYSYDHPYTRWHVIYPPLVTVYYTIIGHFTVPYIEIPTGDDLSSELIRNSQMGMMSFLVITLLTFYALYVIFSKIMKEKDVRKGAMFLFTVLLAYPFIYAVERGNSVILALVFCFIFLLGYRSENKIIRYASYVALGCAAGIKLYPALLLLLIFRERRYKEAAICIAVVAALVVVPFIFTDGSFAALFSSVTSYAGANLGVTNLNQIVLGVFQEMLGFSEGIVSIISYAVIGVFTLLSVIVILFDRKMKFWKVVALLSCNLILGLGVGVQYQIVYMAMPILYFLSAEREMTKENKLYAFCFAMTMVLIPGIVIAEIYPSAVIGAIESAFVIVIAVALLYEGLKNVYRNRSVGHPSPDT